MSGPGPSWRDIEREIAAVDDDPAAIDTVDVWRAFISAGHSLEFRGRAMQNAIRDLWSVYDGEEIERLSPDEIEELDRDIYRRLAESEMESPDEEIARDLGLDPTDPGEPTEATDLDEFDISPYTAARSG